MRTRKPQINVSIDDTVIKLHASDLDVPNKPKTKAPSVDSSDEQYNEDSIVNGFELDNELNSIGRETENEEEDDFVR